MPNDFNIPMSDAQITQALQLMVERVSEGWAQETYDGSPVGSGSPYYHKSSKWWAKQAADAAARAEAAVPAGTAGAVFFDRVQTLTDSQKEQARQNIKAGGSNRNLFDNPWFTSGNVINQRGVSSAASAAYGIDRWFGAGGGYTLSSDGITITGAFVQKWETPLYSNRPYTFSVLWSDGTVESATRTGSGNFNLPSGQKAGLQPTLQQINISPTATGRVISAVKLELGSVSTLANDAPPNYAEELARCQYYFERINAISNMELGVGIGTSSILYLNYNAKPKRAYPTLTLTGTVKTARSAVENTATSIAQQWFDVNTGLMHLSVNVTATAGTPYRVILMADSHIDISADL